MDDVISRQAAIDTLNSLKKFSLIDSNEYLHGVGVRLKFAVQMLEQLPSAQPDVPDTNVGDLISREAIGNALNRMRVNNNETWYSFYQRVLDDLCKLPSAQPERCEGCINFGKTRLLIPQPEIIRCKDCRFHEQEQPGMVYCPATVGGWVEENWFCKGGERRSDADGERSAVK